MANGYLGYEDELVVANGYLGYEDGTELWLIATLDMKTS